MEGDGGKTPDLEGRDCGRSLWKVGPGGAGTLSEGRSQVRSEGVTGRRV